MNTPALPTSDEQFVCWFRSVAPYIHKFRHQTFVIAIVGEAIADGRLAAIANDIALIQSMGARIVLVHGFRPQVAEQLQAKGHPPRYCNGLRITDSLTLDCAQEAAGQLRYEIEAAFSQGLANTPMAGARVRVLSGNFVTARPVGIVDGVDFGHSGVVRKVDAEGIRKTLDFGALVLLSPLGFSPTGEAFNLVMEEVATAVAAAVRADKLLFLTETAGVYGNASPLMPPQQAPQAGHEALAIVTELSVAQARKLLQDIPDAALTAGSALWYVRHCIHACDAGVERSHIIPYSVDGALLLEIYVHDGIGTMVVNEKLEFLREAGHDDVASIVQLIAPFEQDGTLIRRDRTEIERDIGCYSVLEHDGVIFGCAALYPYPKMQTAEMAALTIAAQAQGSGDGERLLKRIEQRARALGLKSIFVLTTRTMHWFLKRGFVQVAPEWLPAERLETYNHQRKSQVLMKTLSSPSATTPSKHTAA